METDITILGAGPYGLAAAAAVQGGGHAVKVLGDAMSFWDGMPEGMLLRSPYVASSIGSPRGPLSLDGYAAATGTTVSRPIPLEQFVDYGRWFQKRAVPELDPREVVRVESVGEGFRLVLDDDTELATRRVLVAAGIGAFPRIPQLFRELPAERVSHASAHRDLSAFRGRRVLVIGAGQSALEYAALLAEGGADTQIAARADFVHWLRPMSSRLRRLGPVSTLLYAPAEVGPPGLSRLVEAPNLVRRMPADRRHQLDRRSIRPAGAAWLRNRIVGRVPLVLHREVTAAQVDAAGLAVQFSDGASTVVDHILLATGYQVDLSRYSFLSEDLRARVRQDNGYPLLARGFESSVPGLHFLGAPSAWTFGPLMRFVAGTEFTATELGRLLGPSARRRRAV